MHNSKLTFLCALVGPLLLGMGACFLSTEDELYDETYYGYDTGGAQPCNVGAPGCPCTNSGACDDGLVCIGMINTCVIPDTCPTGAAGCECTEGGSCDEGLICKEEYCVNEAPCLAEQTGTESCQCTEGGGCDPGLECLSGLCVDPSGLTTGGESTTGDTGMTSDTTTGGSTGEPDPSGGSSTGSNMTTSAGGG
jgi:hypothetical protein